MTQTISALNVTPAADPGRWPDIGAVPRCPFRAAVARALFTRNADRLPVRVTGPGSSSAASVPPA